MDTKTFIAVEHLPSIGNEKNESVLQLKLDKNDEILFGKIMSRKKFLLISNYCSYYEQWIRAVGLFVGK